MGYILLLDHAKRDSRLLYIAILFGNVLVRPISLEFALARYFNVFQEEVLKANK